MPMSNTHVLCLRVFISLLRIGSCTRLGFDEFTYHLTIISFACVWQVTALVDSSRFFFHLAFNHNNNNPYMPWRFGLIKLREKNLLAANHGVRWWRVRFTNLQKVALDLISVRLHQTLCTVATGRPKNKYVKYKSAKATSKTESIYSVKWL